MTISSRKFSLFFLLTFLLSGMVSAHSQTLTFAPKVDYSTNTSASFGLHPYAVAVGDLNNDSWLDIVTVNSNNNNISVFINNQNGTFASAVNYSIGNSPRSLVLADLNGDGSLDVAAANFAGNTVAVRLGNGDGTFQSSTAYLVGGQPNAIAVGDIDHDGSPDLITAGGAGILSYLHNSHDGSGTFELSLPTIIEVTTGLVLADFDGDGNLDIASTSNALISERITVRFGDGTGAFNGERDFALPTGGAFALRAADVDGDRNLDLITANTGNGAVGGYSVAKGDGLGNFLLGSDTPLGLIPFALEIADLNGDGFPDLLFANSAQSEAAIVMGTGTGTFQSQQGFATGSQPNSIAVGDFDKDGKPDMVTANSSSNSISVLINTTLVAARTLTGHIFLEATNSSAVPINFVFHPQDGSASFTRIVTPAGNGEFVINNIAPKVYDVSIKGAKWLQARLTADAVSGPVTDFNVTLLGGDASNDNAVDVSDLLLLIAHYNTSLPDPAYLEAADFNNDGSCDITDLNLLISHYNTLGSP